MKVRTLGIELRKIGSIAAIYNDVDAVLANTDNHMIAQQTTAHALNKMLKPSAHMSVCTIRECAKVAHVCIPAENMNVYSSVHCMDWNEMTPEFRQLLVAMILNDFRGILDTQYHSSNG